MIAHNPLHGSQRAGSPPHGLASGDNAKSPQGIGRVTRGGGSQRSTSRRILLPGQPPGLAAPPERAVPEPADLANRT